MEGGEHIQKRRGHTGTKVLPSWLLQVQRILTERARHLVTTGPSTRLSTQALRTPRKKVPQKHVTFADGTWPGWVEPKKRKRGERKKRVDDAHSRASSLQPKMSSEARSVRLSSQANNIHHNQADHQKFRLSKSVVTCDRRGCHHSNNKSGKRRHSGNCRRGTNKQT